MGKQWIKLGSVSSTNSYVSELQSQGKGREPLVVIADYQDAGRGQGTHSWHSREGENLLMSLLLFPAFLSASAQFHLSRVASLAICDTLDSVGVTARIKWPNDILTDKGKIAGILIEHGISGSQISHSIIGIGLNLNQTDFPVFPVPASSVKLEKGFNLVPEDVAVTLEQHLQDRYNKLEYGFSHKLEQDYLDKLFLINQEASFRSGRESFQAVIRGVNEFGELMVERDGEMKAYGHGDIKVAAPR
jgi:BirA family biotin operon repressor/biotin-[acetyl-CoA-carboxylase] ligase